MRDRYVFAWQSMKISNVSNTLTLKQIFWRTKTFFKNLENYFLVKTTNIETNSKLVCQRPMLKQIEWWLQNGPIIMSGVLPVATLFSWKFCPSFRTSEKELIWYTNDPNVHIRIFRKRWSLILSCVFPVSILLFPRLVFSRVFDIRGNLGNANEKPTRKTCFCREIKRLALRIYLAKFCLAAFLRCQQSFYCNFKRKRCWYGGEYVKSENMWKRKIERKVVA